MQPMWLLGCLWKGAETTREDETQESWSYTCFPRSSQIKGRVFKVSDWLPSSPLQQGGELSELWRPFFPWTPVWRCRRSWEDDDGSNSEEEEIDEDSEYPVATLLRTLSSLSDDDQKRAVLALQLQLNSIVDNKWDLHGDLYASLAGGIYSVFAYVT